MYAFAKRVNKAIQWRVEALIHQKNDPDEQFNAVLCSLISKDIASPTIFDVGAHHGESIKRYKKLFPSAAIHSFEPDVENF
jgi:hypothetical protein